MKPWRITVIAFAALTVAAAVLYPSPWLQGLAALSVVAAFMSFGLELRKPSE